MTTISKANNQSGNNSKDTKKRTFLEWYYSWTDYHWENTKTVIGFVLSASFGVAAFQNVVSTKIVIILVALLLQICSATAISKKLHSIRQSQQSEIRLLSESAKQVEYYRSLAREMVAISTSLPNAEKNQDISSFYIKFLASLNALIRIEMGENFEKTCLQLYEFKKSCCSLSRVDVSNNIVTINSPKQFRGRKLSQKISDKTKYYERCLKDETRSTFFLENNGAIIRSFVDINERCKARYSQYYAAKQDIGDFILFIEIISFDDAQLSSNGGINITDRIATPLFNLISALCVLEVQGGKACLDN